MSNNRKTFGGALLIATITILVTLIVGKIIVPGFQIAVYSVSLICGLVGFFFVNKLGPGHQYRKHLMAIFLGMMIWVSGLLILPIRYVTSKQKYQMDSLGEVFGNLKLLRVWISVQSIGYGIMIIATIFFAVSQVKNTTSCPETRICKFSIFMTLVSFIADFIARLVLHITIIENSIVNLGFVLSGIVCIAVGILAIILIFFSIILGAVRFNRLSRRLANEQATPVKIMVPAAF